MEHIFCVFLLIIALFGVNPALCRYYELELLFEFGKTLSTYIYQPLMAVGSFTLLLIIVGVFISYNRITTNIRELARSKLQLRMSEITQEHIEQIRNLYTQLSTVRHDLNNHFAAINGYINSGAYEQLKEYVNALTEINDNSTSEYTKHPVLNALIGTRINMAKSLNINFTFNIILPDELPINDVDLCILISNILDNAFESNERVKESRFINLYTRIENSYWIIACRNATCQRGNFRATGSLKSTKEYKEVHGIGTKQIRKIAEKTGGFVTYRHENYEFSTLVMIKM